eukprot:TRINITY_DN5525_c0_g1_i1.p1 TRINITY_DN5525_c0_g1~~TRINITY_DN5525_c0_g1_i1.p1  ORF type:complete len:585 (-),score=112.97 TRINITY_DN5525_c0_g1_i1:14-1768(-)
MGPHQLLYCVASSENLPGAQASALMLLFRLVKDDDKLVRDALPVGSISVLSECLNSQSAECRRGALGLLWLYSLQEEDQCLNFGKLGVVDALIKLLYSDVTPALLCSVTILCKCVSQDSIQKMKTQDILPRLIDLVDYEEHSIKCGAMRLLPKFDRQRVAELGGINKLLKVVQDYHDKIESVTMMALIVLEYLSHDDQNKSLMGKDDTISVMISMLGSEKSELQKQAMLILTSISQLDINARKIRQQSGLDSLVNILDRTDLPDVQHSVLHAIVDTTSDIIESGTLDSLEALKRLELSLPKLCEMLNSKNLHAIVREAAASALELCVVVLSLNPRQVQDVVRAALSSIDTALNPDPSLPPRAFKSLHQMLSASLRLLARALENFPSNTTAEDLEDSIISYLPQLSSVLLDASKAPLNLEGNLCWLLCLMCQSEKICSAICMNQPVVERLVRPLLTEDAPEARLRASLMASYLTVHQKSFPLQEEVSRNALLSLETTSTNITLQFRLFNVSPFLPLLASPNTLLKTVGMWFSASVSHSAQGRRRVKQFLGSHVLDDIRQQAPDSQLLLTALTNFDKNMSVSSVFA